MTLRCSMLEIYKETLRDLFCQEVSQHRDLKIKESPKRGVFVDGLVEECVTCSEEIFELLEWGNNSRIVASTKLN